MREPQVGDILAGKYEVRGVLGRGGMGLVISAWHKELGQRVAIKYLLPEALLSSEVVERFAREARAAAQIQGEHVVRILDVGKFEDGSPFMVMEHLEGNDLAVVLARQGRLAVTDAVRCILQACEALAQAHAAGIVHRDLKPSNLFLATRPGREPTVKVLDFGISKFTDPSSDAITKTAAVIGTAHYMSPEQLLAAKSVDERSDLWSLGIILYQLLVGQPPFVGDSAPEIIAKIIQNLPTPPRARREDIPAGLEAVILRCLRTEPRDRFAHVAALANALLPFAAAEDADSVAAISRVVESSPRPRVREMETPLAPLIARVAPPLATPMEIASTISELNFPAPKKSRRWGVLALVGTALAGVGVGIAWSGQRSPVAPTDTSTGAATTHVDAAVPVFPADASAVLSPAIPGVSSPLQSAATAAPSSSVVAGASLRRGVPHPRPQGSAPPRDASSPSAPAASSSASADPLDIPLR
jgi:serine/threonine protein kinase